MAVRARPKSRRVDPTPGRVESSDRETNALIAYFACIDYVVYADCLMATLIRTRRTASSCSYNPGFYRALNNGDNISADLIQASASQSLRLPADTTVTELPSDCFLVERVIASRRRKVIIVL